MGHRLKEFKAVFKLFLRIHILGKHHVFLVRQGHLMIVTKKENPCSLFFGKTNIFFGQLKVSVLMTKVPTASKQNRLQICLSHLGVSSFLAVCSMVNPSR